MSYCYDNALLNIQDFVFYMQVGLGLNVKKTKGMFFNFNVSLLLTVAREVAKQSLIKSGDQGFEYLWGIRAKKTER